jgi:hypothetical protein
MNTGPFASITRFPTGFSTLVLKRWGERIASAVIGQQPELPHRVQYLNRRLVIME